MSELYPHSSIDTVVGFFVVSTEPGYRIHRIESPELFRPSKLLVAGMAPADLNHVQVLRVTVGHLRKVIGVPRKIFPFTAAPIPLGMMLEHPPSWPIIERDGVLEIELYSDHDIDKLRLYMSGKSVS